MKDAGTVLVLAAALCLAAAAAGCTGGSPWVSRVEEPEQPPYPPEKLLRKPPDFRLRDLDNSREFLLYFYEDQDFREEVVTVTNLTVPERDQRPRLATIDEHEYAIQLFIRQWRSRSDEEKLRYFNELHLQELRRNATLLDQQIRFKEAARKDLLERKIAMEADLKSRKDTNTFHDGSEKFHLISTSALEHQIALVDRQLAETEVMLMVLRHLRAQRDAEFGRSAAALFLTATFRVRDLLPYFSEPQRLADSVRTNVDPQAWNRPMAMIEVREGHLVVRQVRAVLEQVERYLDRLREELPARR